MGLRNNRIIALLLALCLVVSLTVAVYAYLSAKGGTVHNTFTPDVESDPIIKESTATKGPGSDLITFKKDVQVDVGSLDYAVYVRTVIVVTWKDDAGKVHAQKPIAGTDYEISLNDGDGKPWFFKDGFFYHRAMVPADGDHLTAILIDSCRQLLAGPEGYYLSVEIIAQTVQALGSTDAGSIPAVEDAWKSVTVDGSGYLIPKL